MSPAGRASLREPVVGPGEEALSETPRPVRADVARCHREIDDLTAAIFREHDYDFRHYARASLERRLRACLADEELLDFPALQERIVRDPDCMQRVLLRLSIIVTAMFRDPSFFRALRVQAVPWLRTFPTVRSWVAGCSTGEEAYSLALLPQEEGLYERSRVYATDMSAAALAKASAGIYPLAAMKQHTRNYLEAGGSGELSRWYTANYGKAKIGGELKRNLVFAQHNLVTDGVFNEFQMVLCRNVMIYFDRELQAHVHSLIYDSLAMFGILGLGQKESMAFTPHESCYETMDSANKLYKKVK